MPRYYSDRPATPLSGPEMDEWLEQIVEWHGADEAAQPLSGVPELVPRTATPLGGIHLADMFNRGHELARGRPIGSKRLAECALAIIGVENARGRAIIQHNWGNISCTPTTWSGPMWQTPTPQRGQPLYFRAYETHEGGCSAWWRLMYRSHRGALEAAAKGRPDRMVDSLYASRYVVGGSQGGYRHTAIELSESYRRSNLFGRWEALRLSAADFVGIGELAASGLFIVGLQLKRAMENRR